MLTRLHLGSIEKAKPLSISKFAVASFSCRYGKGSFSFSGLVSGITKRFSTEFELQEVCCHPTHTLWTPSRAFRVKSNSRNIYSSHCVYLSHSLTLSISAKEILWREASCWFWLCHLGNGAGHRENCSQHQVGEGKQRSCAEVADWRSSMRTTTVPKGQIHTWWWLTLMTRNDK